MCSILTQFATIPCRCRRHRLFSRAVLTNRIIRGSCCESELDIQIFCLLLVAGDLRLLCVAQANGPVLAAVHEVAKMVEHARQSVCTPAPKSFDTQVLGKRKRGRA